jgi:hypothetical protein
MCVERGTSAHDPSRRRLSATRPRRFRGNAGSDSSATFVKRRGRRVKLCLVHLGAVTVFKPKILRSILVVPSDQPRTCRALLRSLPHPRPGHGGRRSAPTTHHSVTPFNLQTRTVRCQRGRTSAVGRDARAVDGGRGWMFRSEARARALARASLPASVDRDVSGRRDGRRVVPTEASRRARTASAPRREARRRSASPVVRSR